MKNQTLPFLRYAFLCTLLLSTAAAAMEKLDHDDLTSPVSKKSLKNYPAPPTITYADYVINFCTDDGEMEGWGKPSGNLGSWLQSNANQATFTNKDGTALGDFPLFQVTLNPILEGEMIRCDYSIPVIVSDSNEEFPTLSLFHNGSKAEIESVSKLKPEPFMGYTRRLLQWQEELKKGQEVSNSIEARIILGHKFVPQVKTHERSFHIVFDRPSARTIGNFAYLNLSFDNSIMVAKTSLETGKVEPENMVTDIDGYRNSDTRQDLLLSVFNGGTEVDYSNYYLFSEQEAHLTAHSFAFNNCFFDVVGDCTLTTTKINFAENPELGQSHLWSTGRFIFKSLNENCPINKIKVVAADSTQPIRVMGSIDFQDSKVDLEFLNVSRIDVKLRERIANGNGSL